MNLIVVVGSIFIVLLYLFVYLCEGKNTEKLEKKAEKLGFLFSRSGRKLTKSKHTNFALFSKGYARTLKNEIWGIEEERDVCIFEYCYTKRWGQTSVEYNQTVLSIEFDHLTFPNFSLQPTTVFHKIGKIFGYQDIDFGLFPIFSKKYLLRGEDEVAIRKLFTPQIILFFESYRKVSVEVQGSRFIFYEQRRRWPVGKIENFFNNGQEVLSNFQGHSEIIQLNAEAQGSEGGLFKNCLANESADSSRRKKLGIAGSLLLIIGLFTPVVNASITGKFYSNLNYFYLNGKADGVILFALAIISLFFVFKSKYRGLFITSGLSLLVMMFTFINFHLKRLARKEELEAINMKHSFQFVSDATIQSLQSFQLQWGAVLLFIGVSLIFYSAIYKKS